MEGGSFDIPLEEQVGGEKTAPSRIGVENPVELLLGWRGGAGRSSRVRSVVRRNEAR